MSCLTINCEILNVLNFNFIITKAVTINMLNLKFAQKKIYILNHLRMTWLQFYDYFKTEFDNLLFLSFY